MASRHSLTSWSLSSGYRLDHESNSVWGWALKSPTERTVGYLSIPFVSEGGRWAIPWDEKTRCVLDDEVVFSEDEGGRVPGLVMVEVSQIMAPETEWRMATEHERHIAEITWRLIDLGVETQLLGKRGDATRLLELGLNPSQIEFGAVVALASDPTYPAIVWGLIADL